MSKEIKETETYIRNFAEFEKDLDEQATGEIHNMRRNAINLFSKVGFPGTREEEWRYTNVAPIAKTEFMLFNDYDRHDLDVASMDKLYFKNWQGWVLVFINGFFSEEFSKLENIPDGIKILNMAEALRSDSEIVRENLNKSAGYENDPFFALNTAFMRDGAFITVADNTVIEKDIHLMFVSTESKTKAHMAYPRNLISVGRNSRLQVVETYVGISDNIYFNNHATEIFLDENAQLEYNRIQNESRNAFHIENINIHQKRSSVFHSNSIDFGGALVRNNIYNTLDAEGAETTLNGIYVGSGQQHIDNHTFIDHAKPYCNSKELYRGILDDKSGGVFSGKIMVRQDAQKTDANQSNNCLLLSEDATIDSKPQLEIYADDVRCTHGATVGQLDKDAIFYLKSRGISEKQAHSILTYAFVKEVIDHIKIDSVRESIDEILRDRLA
ncbi:MAG: Fe-S cluster assembly protein SufD [Calditrichaceae bacterium]